MQYPTVFIDVGFLGSVWNLPLSISSYIEAKRQNGIVCMPSCVYAISVDILSLTGDNGVS